MNLCNCAPRLVFDSCLEEFELGDLTPNTDYSFYFRKIANNNSLIKVDKTTDANGKALFTRIADFPPYYINTFAAPFEVFATLVGELNLENTVDFTVGTETYPCLVIDFKFINNIEV